MRKFNMPCVDMGVDELNAKMWSVQVYLCVEADEKIADLEREIFRLKQLTGEHSPLKTETYWEK